MRPLQFAVYDLDAFHLGLTDGGGIAFTNLTAIVINDNAVATPYPSNIMVAGMPGAVTNVTAKLNSITHTKPTDIDMLLIGPAGQTAIIMSLAGGFPGVTNVTLTLDDSPLTHCQLDRRRPR